MTDADKEVERFKREMLATRLDQCTQAQRDLFGKIYPGKVPAGKLMQAIDLCDRTIAKNKKLNRT